MKKYFIILLIPILYGCSKTNEFANRNFRVVSVAELVVIYGVEVRVPDKMLYDRILIWKFIDSEVLNLAASLSGGEVSKGASCL